MRELFQGKAKDAVQAIVVIIRILSWIVKVEKGRRQQHISRQLMHAAFTDLSSAGRDQAGAITFGGIIVVQAIIIDISLLENRPR